MNSNATNVHTRRPPRKKKALADDPSSLRGSGSTKCPHPPQSHTSSQPVLDQRVPELLLDAISSVKAAIVSASARLPYGEARQAMAVDEQEQQELTRALREAAERHPAFFRQNKTEIEFCVAWAAVHAAQIDSLLILTDNTNTMEEPGCSPRGSLFVALLVLGPLLIFAVISIVQHLRRV